MSEYFDSASRLEIPTAGGAVLRQTELGDAQGLLQLFKANKGRLRSAKMQVPKKMREVERRIDVFNSHGYLDFGIWAGNQLAGEITLMPHHGSPDIGEVSYWLDKAHTGHGYATDALKSLTDYAFGSLGFRLLTAQVDIANQDRVLSMRTLQRAGFQPLSAPAAGGRAIVYVRRGDDAARLA